MNDKATGWVMIFRVTCLNEKCGCQYTAIDSGDEQTKCPKCGNKGGRVGEIYKHGHDVRVISNGKINE